MKLQLGILPMGAAAETIPFNTGAMLSINAHTVNSLLEGHHACNAAAELHVFKIYTVFT